MNFSNLFRRFVKLFWTQFEFSFIPYDNYFVRSYLVAGPERSTLLKNIALSALVFLIAIIGAGSLQAQTFTLTSNDLASDDNGTVVDDVVLTYSNAGGGGVTMTFNKTAGSSTGEGGDSEEIYSIGGTGPVSGLWLGSDDNSDPGGQVGVGKHAGTGVDSETYVMTFTGAEPVQVELSFGAVNRNDDGDERFVIDSVIDAGGNDITSSTTFAFVSRLGRTEFDQISRQMRGTAGGGASGDSGGVLTISASAGIRTLNVRRIEVPNTILDKPEPSRNRTNGITMGPISYTIQSVIDAVDEPILPARQAGEQDIYQVLDNDTLRGNPATLSNVDISVVTPASPVNPGDPVPTLNPLDGTVDVPFGTPFGSYEIIYQICEAGATVHCDTASINVGVEGSLDPIAAEDDDAGIVQFSGSNTKENVANVYLDNGNGPDTLNGSAINQSSTPPPPFPTNITIITPAGPGTVPILDPATGLVSVPAGTPVGNYTITYELCENANPANCDQADVTLEVVGAPTAQFPPGDGLSLSACKATSPGAFGQGAVIWEHNASSGTDPNPTILNGDIFATGSAATYSGIQAQVNSFDVNINRDTIPANYSAGSYMQYVMTIPTDETRVRELTGLSFAQFARRADGGFGDQTTGGYYIAAQVSEDAAFANPVLLLSDTRIENGDTSNADSSFGPSQQAKLDYNYAHHDADNVVRLKPGGTYYVRVYPFADFDSGNDQGQAYPDPVLWDDVRLKAVSCGSTIELIKTVTSVSDTNNNGTIGDVGDTVNYDFTVRNTGDVDLIDVTVTDAGSDITGSVAALAAGTADTTTIKGTRLITVADLAEGRVVNTADVTATQVDSVGNPVLDPVTGDPFTITDTSDTGSEPTLAGTTPTLITNPATTESPETDGSNDGDAGNDPTIVNLFSIMAMDDNLVDPIETGTGATNVLNVLTDNGSGQDTVNGSSPVAADVVITPVGTLPTGITIDANGSVSVAAGTPTGVYNFDYEICEVANTSNCDTATVTLEVVDGGIGVVKGSIFDDQNGDGFAQVGETITYDYAVSNIGDLPLQNVTLTETTFTGTGNVPTLVRISGDDGDNILQTTEVWVYRTSYALTAADITAGNVENQARALGETPGGTPVSDNSDSRNPSDGNGSGDPGQGGPNNEPTNTALSSTPIDALDDIASEVVDSTNTTLGILNLFADNGSGPDTLTGNPTDEMSVTINPAPGETIPAGLTLNPDGTVDVLAETAPGPYSFDYQICEIGNPTNCDIATASLTVGSGGIGLTKASTFNDENSDGFGQIGETITFTYSATNTGDFPLSDVTLTETGFTGNGAIPVPAFQSGDDGNNLLDLTETWIFTATYTLIATDLIDGTVDNQAQARGETPGGTPVTDVSDSENPSDGNGTGTPGGGTGNDDPTTTPILTRPILAQDDIVPGVVDNTNGPLTDVINVFNDNGNGADTLNNVPTDSSQATVEVVLLAPPPAGITLNPDGSVDISTSTPPGEYTFDYEICEIGNPTNCSEATVTLTVGEPLIGVVKASTFTDAGSGTPANDNNTTAETGEIVEYTYNVSNLGNLDISTVTLTEAPADFTGTGTISTPVLDGATDIGGDGILSVGEIWTYNSTYALTAVDIVASQITNQAIASGTSPSGTPITDRSDSPNPGDGDGTGTPGSGSGNDDPTTTLYTSPDVAANDDILPDPVDATVAIPVVLNIFTATDVGMADTVNGNPATATPGPGQVVVTVGTIVPPELTFDPTTGDVGVVANAPPGPYTFTYEICDAAATTVCDVAVVEITVGEGKIGVVKESVFEDENLDTFAQVGETISYVYTISNEGDFDLDPVTLMETGFSGTGALPIPAFITTSDTGSDGILSVDESWIYSATYALTADDITAGNVDNAATATGTTPNGGMVEDISDSRNPSDGDGVGTPGPDGPSSEDPTSTPLTSALIEATDDSVSDVDGLTGETDVANVLTNNGGGPDTLGGVSTNISLVTISVDTPAVPIRPGAPVPVLDPATGAVDVPPGTPSGPYNIIYEICETLNPANCDTATVTINVVAPQIAAVDDDFTDMPFNGKDGDVTPTVFTNDTLNGVPFVPTDISVSVTDAGGLTGATINPDGTVNIPPDTPAGLYAITYEICDIVNPDNCATAVATIQINEIDAVVETFDVVNGQNGGITSSILTSDTLNGTLISDPSNVILTIDTIPAGLSIDPATNGVTVPAGTPNGSYEIIYTICDATNSSICDTVTETIVVGEIQAVVEIFSPLPASGGTTTISILDSDTLNGAPVTPDSVNITVRSIPDGLTVNPDNTITVAPGLAAGEYEINYEICDVANPDICSVATEVITILPGAALEVIKTQEMTDNGDGVDGVGDTIRYTITIENTGNVAVNDIVAVDTLTDGNAVELTLTSGPDFASSDVGSLAGSLLIGETATYTAEYLLTAEAVASGLVSNTVVATANPIPPADYTGPPLQPVEDVSDQGVLSDGDDNPTVMAFAASVIEGLTVAKTAGVATVLRGGNVPYTITITNDNPAIATSAVTLDKLPEGFVYVPDTATINGDPVTPVVEGGRVLSFPEITIAPNSATTITLNARVLPGSGAGEKVNEARITNPNTGEDLALPAFASVRVEVEQVFDCTEIIGKVFIDHNGNGRQDPDVVERSAITNQAYRGGKGDVIEVPRDEVGVPNVRLATVDGSVITTDEFGRFSVPCAMLPAQTGSQFILKIDDRSLPTGFRVTTENPRVMRVTPGMLHEMNFGVAIGRVVRVDLSSAAFAVDKNNNAIMRPELVTGITSVLRQIAGETVSLRISFFVQADANGQDVTQARALMDMVDDEIRRQWHSIGRVRLLIEQNIVRVEQ